MTQGPSADMWLSRTSKPAPVCTHLSALPRLSVCLHLHDRLYGRRKSSSHHHRFQGAEPLVATLRGTQGVYITCFPSVPWGRRLSAPVSVFCSSESG